jgi:PAS domain-containing protein
MILIKRGTAIFLYFLFTAVIIAIGIYAYVELGGESKAKAETILYISISGAAVILVAFIVVSGRTLSLYRELDKMIELNKSRDFSPELSMKKLGSIGERITLLYFSLNALNERKTLKISALAGLADFLADNIEIPFLATDVQGFVRYVSRSFTEGAGRPRSEIIGRNVEEVFPDVPFRDSILELDKLNSPVELKESKGPLTLIGIRNRRNELSYVAWLFEGMPHLPEKALGGEKVKNRGDRLTRIFRRRSE